MRCKMTQISVKEFETKVLKLEEIVIRVRAPSGAKVEDYEYARKAAGSQSVSDWLEGRIKPLIGDYEVDVLDGNYATPHGRTKLETLRSSYER
jgi:hypothetical protein